jgi:hypothetical protein
MGGFWAGLYLSTGLSGGQGLGRFLAENGIKNSPILKIAANP